MPSAIDAAAQTLREDGLGFTERNLLYAVRRAEGDRTTEQKFRTSLRRRLARGPLPGLLPSSDSRSMRKLARGLAEEWDARPPAAVLLVDRPAIVGTFMASGVSGSQRLAVVCIDGSPAPVVAALKRGLRAGHRAPVLYIHDAGTVIYPFSVEPLATILERSDPLAYADLGLAPLGTTARRFGDPKLPPGELLFDLEAIPPAALVRYCSEAARRLVPTASARLTESGDRRRARSR